MRIKYLGIHLQYHIFIHHHHFSFHNFVEHHPETDGNWAAVGVTADALIPDSSVAPASSGCSSTTQYGAGSWAYRSTASASSDCARELGGTAARGDWGGLALAAVRLDGGARGRSDDDNGDNTTKMTTTRQKRQQQ